MPTDLAHVLVQVDWLYVAVLAIFVFLSSLIGSLLSFSHRGTAAVLSAVVFVVIFIAWTYYPHGFPLPTRLTDQTAPATMAIPAPVAPVAPATPVRPRNPVTDITPPKNPVTDITPPAR